MLLAKLGSQLDRLQHRILGSGRRAYFAAAGLGESPAGRPGTDSCWPPLPEAAPRDAVHAQVCGARSALRCDPRSAARPRGRSGAAAAGQLRARPAGPPRYRCYPRAARSSAVTDRTERSRERPKANSCGWDGGHPEESDPAREAPGARRSSRARADGAAPAPALTPPPPGHTAAGRKRPLRARPPNRGGSRRCPCGAAREDAAVRRPRGARSGRMGQLRSLIPALRSSRLRGMGQQKVFFSPLQSVLRIWEVLQGNAGETAKDSA